MERSRDIKKDNTRGISDIVREEKRILRKEVLKKRDALTSDLHKCYSRDIRSAVQSWEVYRKAKVLLSFVSFGSEVDTQILIKDAIADGKKVYCPRVQGEEMFFYRIHSPEDLKPGYRGILEPVKGEPFDEKTKEKVLLLVPGTVFDKERNRIGYGRGFYDRFIRSLRESFSLTTAALAFSLQVVDSVPTEEHDIRPGYLFTENGIYGASIINRMERENAYELDNNGRSCGSCKV